MIRALVLCLVFPSFSYGGIIQLTDDDVGEVVQVIDVSIGHFWEGEVIEDVAPFDWASNLQLRTWNGSEWLPTGDPLSFGIIDLDPATLIPTVIDELNAASFDLDWEELELVFLESFVDPLVQARMYETATSAVGMSDTMPESSQASTVLGMGYAYHAGMILDHFEISLFQWEQRQSGVRFSMRVEAYAEITNAPENVPEPNAVLLLAFVLGLKPRYRRST